MKLLTLNCHSWQEKNQEEKIKHLAEVIHKKQFDIIALQEVSQLCNSEDINGNIKKDNYIIALIEALKELGNEEYKYVWDFSHIGYDIYEEGLGILAKYPIIDKKSFYVSKSTDKGDWKSRNIVKATVKYNEEEIDIYSCHLGWWNDNDEPCSYQIDNLLKEVKSDRLSFVMGDFNSSATIRDEGYDYLIEGGLKDTYDMAIEKDNGITVEGIIDGWKNNKGDLRIDIIFSNKDVEVNSSRVIFNGVNNDIVSDHYGVEVDINI